MMRRTALVSVALLLAAAFHALSTSTPRPPRAAAFIHAANATSASAQAAAENANTFFTPERVCAFARCPPGDYVAPARRAEVERRLRRFCMLQFSLRNYTVRADAEVARLRRLLEARDAGDPGARRERSFTSSSRCTSDSNAFGDSLRCEWIHYEHPLWPKPPHCGALAVRLDMSDPLAECGAAEHLYDRRHRVLYPLVQKTGTVSLREWAVRRAKLVGDSGHFEKKLCWPLLQQRSTRQRRQLRVSHDAFWSQQWSMHSKHAEQLSPSTTPVRALLLVRDPLLRFVSGAKEILHRHLFRGERPAALFAKHRVRRNAALSVRVGVSLRAFASLLDAAECALPYQWWQHVASHAHYLRAPHAVHMGDAAKRAARRERVALPLATPMPVAVIVRSSSLATDLLAALRRFGRWNETQLRPPFPRSHVTTTTASHDDDTPTLEKPLSVRSALGWLRRPRDANGVLSPIERLCAMLVQDYLCFGFDVPAECERVFALAGA